MRKRDMILVGKGQVRSKSYTGPVEVYVEKEFTCPDLYVRHGACGRADDEREHDPATDETFHREIVRLLKARGLLSRGREYRLESAEWGMQGWTKTVYESIKMGRKDVSKDLCLSAGAKENKG